MKTPRQDPPKASDRNDRLKAALKANIARRKAQAKAKAVKTTDQIDKDEATEGSEEE